MKKPVFITGMPGSGKTTVGKLVAYDLSVPFFDLDRLIEQREKKIITSIFNEMGEDSFRIIEHEILTRFIEEHKDKIYILSLGGGTVCFFDTIQKLKQAGTLIYLETTVDQLLDQLDNETQKRPLLVSGNKTELKSKLEKLLLERKPFYSKANFTVESNADKRITMADIVEIIDKSAKNKPL